MAMAYANTRRVEKTSYLNYLHLLLYAQNCVVYKRIMKKMKKKTKLSSMFYNVRTRNKPEKTGVLRCAYFCSKIRLL